MLPAVSAWARCAVGAGDLNGDGFDDIAVGADGAGVNPGQVFIFPGSLTGPRVSPPLLIDSPSRDAMGQFGYPLAWMRAGRGMLLFASMALQRGRFMKARRMVGSPMQLRCTLVLLTLAGCTQFPAAPTDAATDDGRTDAPVDLGVDSEVGDAGPADTGTGDVAAADVQTPDIGTADGGTTDVVNDVASGDLGTVEAGTGDTGVSDVGMDAGAADAGAIDTGSADADPGDAGAPDVNPTDLGPTDAGIQDTGTLDVGPADAGTTDLGPADTGPTCAPPATLCGSSCVSLTDDVMHCGACTTVCPAPARANAISACVAGSCGSTCAPGFDEVAGVCVAIAAPRPIAPLSSAVVTSTRPRLRWANEGRLDGAVVELCDDRACTRPIGAPIRVTGTEATPPVGLAPGVVFWRLRGRIGSREGLTTYSATWQFTVGHRDTPVRTSWGHASHDINGDGYDDIVVSAAGERRVYVYYGSATGITTAVATTLTESASDYGVPRIVGDLDGDDLADVVVGADAARTIFIYRGGNGASAPLPPRLSRHSLALGATSRRRATSTETASRTSSSGHHTRPAPKVPSAAAPSSIPVTRRAYWSRRARSISIPVIDSSGVRSPARATSTAMGSPDVIVGARG
nr:FG-GAP repeat protein [Deltaproteobacteria bacterium]